MSEPEKRIALLIDADNAPSSKIDEILVEVAAFGVANVRRAYGDWKNPRLKGWESVLHEFAIRPIQQFAYSKGKNASDMAMVVDAMDLLYARNLDGFAIVSSDADFTPLVMRILTDGLKVYGFGEQKTPKPFVNACSKFTYVEALAAPSASRDAAPAASKPSTQKQLRGDTRLLQQVAKIHPKQFRVAAQLAAHEHRRAKPRPILRLERFHDARGHVQARGHIVHAQARSLARKAQALTAPGEGVMGIVGMGVFRAHCVRGAGPEPEGIACKRER